MVAAVRGRSYNRRLSWRWWNYWHSYSSDVKQHARASSPIQTAVIDPNPDIHSDARANAHPSPNIHLYTHGNTYTRASSHIYVHARTYTRAGSYLYAYANAHPNADSHLYAYADSDDD